MIGLASIAFDGLASVRWSIEAVGLLGSRSWHGGDGIMNEAKRAQSGEVGKYVRLSHLSARG